METQKTDAKAKAEVTGKVRKALEHLKAAATLMDQAAEVTTWGMAKGDCLSYRERINGLITCDEDESGLEALVDWLATQNGTGRERTIARRTSGSTYRHR